ncbi:hypothetical protein GCM10010923_16060 [Blastomonas marina]|uniref:Uncharacterized protein n=1 Tax=Blastomonas marina TaxID=1867408 RepID=A0ABQ1FEF9_9SPHN|nr:hypothetical protein [Blastomonas marina]GGA06894.1 hypothetical protein GCM10010923_16060 [Blastomonas marina]
MEGEVITKGFGLLVFGALFVWRGIDGWRHRREERITLIEAATLKIGGEDEPLPLNRWDRMMAYAQPVLMLLFGPAMIVLGFAILLV